MHIFVAFEAIFSAVIFTFCVTVVFASCVAAVILKSFIISTTISAFALHLIFNSKHSTINESALYLVLHYWNTLSWISLFFRSCSISFLTLSFITALLISFTSFQTLNCLSSVTCSVFWSHWINFHHDFDLW